MSQHRGCGSGGGEKRHLPRDLVAKRHVVLYHQATKRSGRLGRIPNYNFETQKLKRRKGLSAALPHVFIAP
jgi:hypothetical protein